MRLHIPSIKVILAQDETCSWGRRVRLFLLESKWYNETGKRFSYRNFFLLNQPSIYAFPQYGHRDVGDYGWPSFSPLMVETLI